MAWRTESASKISIGRIGMSPPDKPMAALCESKLAAARFRSFAGGNDSRDRNPQKPGRRQSALGPNPYLLAAMRLRPSGISGNECPLQPNGDACRPKRLLIGCIPFLADGRAENPPIKKFSPAIVLNAAFEVDQSVAPAFDQRHFGLLVTRNGMHAPQKLGRRQSTLAPDADRLAAMRLRPSGISSNECPLQPNGDACGPKRPLIGCIPFLGRRPREKPSKQEIQPCDCSQCSI